MIITYYSTSSPKIYNLVLFGVKYQYIKLGDTLFIAYERQKP